LRIGGKRKTTTTITTIHSIEEKKKVSKKNAEFVFQWQSAF
jgi:hypothetical protein